MGVHRVIRTVVLQAAGPCSGNLVTFSKRALAGPGVTLRYHSRILDLRTS